MAKIGIATKARPWRRGNQHPAQTRSAAVITALEVGISTVTAAQAAVPRGAPGRGVLRSPAAGGWLQPAQLPCQLTGAGPHRLHVLGLLARPPQQRPRVP